MNTSEPPPNQPEPTPQERAKADRAIKILYAAMAFFILLPFVLLWLKGD